MDVRAGIRLTEEEITRFVETSRNVALGSNGHDGYPHLVAMWYAVKNGDLLMTTYGKSQKAVNLRRDPRATALLESGIAYSELRGVMMRGRAEIIEQPEYTAEVLRLISAKMSGVAISPEQDGMLLAQARRRVAIRFHPEKVASWDHSKLAAALRAGG